MKNKNLNDLKEFYNLDFERAIQNIKKSKAKLVLLQFPDGLKQYAVSIVDYLNEKTKNKTEFLIWFGSCYGACDIPIGLEKIKPKIDLIIQFGHNDKLPEY
jgi:2-(3-amino-3-carboxypropyl)histidine synthase